jgi:hypothetical protein
MANNSDGSAVYEVKVGEDDYIDGLDVTESDGSITTYLFRPANYDEVEAARKRAESAASLASSAASAASGAASRADAAANQALQIANSVAQGAGGESDIAELRRQNGQLATMLADATGKFIYMDGTVYCPASKASVSGDTVSFGGTCSVSGSTVTLA